MAVELYDGSIIETCFGCEHLNEGGYCDFWGTEVDTDEPCHEYVTFDE